MTRRSVPMMAAATLCAAILLSGCGHSSPGPKIGAVGRVAASVPQLRTVTWGVTGGRLSIIVRNASSQLVRSARAVITAKDAHGNSVATTSGPPASGCCGIAQLAPGVEAGIYADLGAAIRRVAAVTVRYTDVAMAQPAPQPPVSIADVSLQTGGDATIVTATMTLSGTIPESVSGQAVLTDAQGGIVAVLSQRFPCLRPGHARAARLRLDGPVPAGTIVASVWTFPTSDGSC
jgi:hypothetical protein